jgi:DNA-binding MarR family transcriptional regulator
MVAADRAEALLTEIAELYAIVLRVGRKIHEGDQPMTATQRLALMEIVAVGPLRLRTLARRMETTPATATRAVDSLEELGFVKRKIDPSDRRGVIVAATTRGTRWSERRAALLREVLGDIPTSAAPARLVDDLARLNWALRAATGNDEVSRSALLAR